MGVGKGGFDLWRGEQRRTRPGPQQPRMWPLPLRLAPLLPAEFPNSDNRSTAHTHKRTFHVFLLKNVDETREHNKMSTNALLQRKRRRRQKNVEAGPLGTLVVVVVTVVAVVVVGSWWAGSGQVVLVVVTVRPRWP